METKDQELIKVATVRKSDLGQISAGEYDSATQEIVGWVSPEGHPFWRCPAGAAILKEDNGRLVFQHLWDVAVVVFTGQNIRMDPDTITELIVKFQRAYTQLYVR